VGSIICWDDRPLPVTDLAATAEGLERFEARGPCTNAERRAANWLHDALRAAGHEAWVETYWVRPQWALSLALHATLGVVASVAAVSAPLPAAIGAALLALSLAVEAAGRVGPLRLLFPRRATQNVLVVPEEDDGVAPSGSGAGDGVAPDITLLVCAGYDAPRVGLVRGLRERMAWVVAALALVAACAGLRTLELEGLWLGALQFVPTVALLLALAAAGDAALAAPRAGGTGPAAVAVALHDELTRDPPGRLSPALLLYGASAAGREALRAHLRREKPARETAVLVEIEAAATNRLRTRRLRGLAHHRIGGPDPASTLAYARERTDELR
jgi:hypothetical protein